MNARVGILVVYLLLLFLLLLLLDKSVAESNTRVSCFDSFFFLLFDRF